jgi:uncharacterized protein
LSVAKAPGNRGFFAAVNSTPDPSDLCLACGLCCDGTLFSKVRLGATDNPARLREKGFALVGGSEPEFAQPCRALESDCRCRIYGERPLQCRKFKCPLLTSVAAGTQNIARALVLISEARTQAKTVRKLLQQLGDLHEDRALSLRYQATETSFRSGTLLPDVDADERAQTFAVLTLAVYRLQATLRRDFYA